MLTSANKEFRRLILFIVEFAIFEHLHDLVLT